MELVPFKPAAGALVGADAGSIPATVAAQQETLHAQADQLHSLVVAQCRLTGVNPLAQEMAAGALSITIGKKPHDLLNTKAVKRMQLLFALKDTIGKKETREISVLCGVTVTQVREFFASQRSRVRKFVNLSREKALRIEASNARGNVCSITTEQTPLDIEARAEVVEPLRILQPVEIPQSSSKPTDIPQFYLQPMELPQSSLQPTDVLQNSLQQAEVQQNHAAPIIPSGTIALQPTEAKINLDSVQKETKEEGVVPGVESEDKKFLDSIFALMRKEETFSGQVKLMEWILQINNVTILSWFLTMGGLTIVSTWLSEAAVEEQTSVILVIFKVLLHLPLHKALPAHMPVVLQTINRLRFYRTQDISSRARILLSKLSKVLVRSQALKKPQKELISKQRISEILGGESWKSEVDNTEEILALTDGTNENRKPEPRKIPMLLTASADEPSKRSAPQTKFKQKRKVLLVEHPNKKVAGKTAHSVRSISTNNSRPISADDIQKAKIRAMFMQEKYGKVDTGKASDKSQAMGTQKASGFVSFTVPPVPRSRVMSTTNEPVDPSPLTSKQSTVTQSDNPETSGSSKLNINPPKYVIEKFDSRRVWQVPPVVWIDPSWSVGAGENSKELEIQTQRNRREKETFYTNQKEIPLNPKDPWDQEMDFDDSLTPEIPIEQQPDADTMDTDTVGATPPATVNHLEGKQVGSTSSTSVADTSTMNDAEKPDFELLAVLLKNPQLVFALTSNKGNVPSEQTVALLDTLKRTGLELSELINNLANGAAGALNESPQPDSVPASLPSPTPASDLTTRAGWGPEHLTHATAPNLRHPQSSIRGNTAIGNTVQQSFSNVVSSLPSRSYASVSVLSAQMQTNVASLPQLVANVDPPIQHVSPVNNHLNRASVHQHSQQYASVSDPVAASFHQHPALNKPAHGIKYISNPAVAHSSVPEPNTSDTAFPWQSSVARVNSTGRGAAPDQRSIHTANSYNISSTNTVPYANQNVYGNHSAQNGHGTYGSVSASSHTVHSRHVLDTDGYSHSAEYQTLARGGHRRQSRSPELGASQDHGGTHVYNPQLRNAGQQSYNPDDEPLRQWSSAHQSYVPAETTSRHQYSSGRHGYDAEPSRPWSSSQQGQNPETLGQWNLRKQDHYNPSNVRRSYDHHHWRR